jgi:hypothetical protein
MYLKKGEKMKERQLIEINRHFFCFSLQVAIQKFDFLRLLLESFNCQLELKIEPLPKGTLLIKTDLPEDRKWFFIQKLINGLTPKIKRGIILNSKEDYWNQSSFAIDEFFFDFKIREYRIGENQFFLEDCGKIPSNLEDLEIIAELNISAVKK